MLKDLSLLLGEHLLDNLKESFVDNVLSPRVTPVVGSVVYCELVFDTTGHSGIYVGDGEIVHLDGSGEIQRVSAELFLNRLDGLNSALSIYVSCIDEDAVGDRDAATKAESMVGETLEYSLFLNNCHMFSASCLDEDAKDTTLLLQNLKDLADKKLGANNWLVWDR